MLDLDALVGQMQRLAPEVVRSARETSERRRRAIEQLAVASRLEERLRSALSALDQEVALPILGRPMDSVYPPPAAADYTVMAVDGSQVPPDYHHVASWYVINTGFAVFRYGPPAGRPRFALGSRPELRPPPPDVRELGADLDVDADARSAAVGFHGPLELERLHAELCTAIDLVHREADPDRTLLLLDGPLVPWRMLTRLPDSPERARVFDAFRQLLETAEQRGVAVAGFVSRTRAVQWVTLLRFSLCPEVEARGELCPACRHEMLPDYSRPLAAAHHAPLAGLADAQIAEELLAGKPGSRTEMLELRADLWRKVSGSAEGPGCFYLHTGKEIARVEVPPGIWSAPERLDRVHAAVWSQCEAGDGYPMVLSEAHEQAVLRGADRRLFYTLIERLLDRHDREGIVPARLSEKARAKGRPLA